MGFSFDTESGHLRELFGNPEICTEVLAEENNLADFGFVRIGCKKIKYLAFFILGCPEIQNNGHGDIFTDICWFTLNEPFLNERC